MSFRRSEPRQRRQVPLSNETEQGEILALKENFGFIKSADRPAEVFFHYGGLSDALPVDELQVGLPVQYRIGATGEKIAAYEVKKLPDGETIQWETQVYPNQRCYGLVERASTKGTCRLLQMPASAPFSSSGPTESDTVAPPEATPLPTAEATADGPLVSYHIHDVTNQAVLSQGDLISFRLIRERRTGLLLARDIHLLLSERDRARHEEDQQLLQQGEWEHGIVQSLKGDYGFLQSNKRREKVFFHYSSLHLEEQSSENKNHENNDETTDGAKTEEDIIIKPGQEMKFIVVEEPNSKKISARKVRLQPQGSVQFHDVVASGVSGRVTVCPQPLDNGHVLEQQGKIRLTQPITITKDDETEVIDEVWLFSKDSPGGTYDYRGGTAVGLYIEVGDILLFDVVRDYVDGAYLAAPTKYRTPRKDPMDMEPEGENETKSVRLIQLALQQRAEGEVNAVKDLFGFIHYTERPVDVHFKLHQLLPDQLQSDLRLNMGLRDKRLQLEVGAEVSFDLSVHGTIVGAAKGSKKLPHERENMKAQRILLLPPKTINFNVDIAKDIKGKVVKAESKNQPGTIEVLDSVRHAHPEERHPLVAKMIENYLASDQKEPLIYHDLQSLKEDEIIVEMVACRGQGKLACSHIPVEGETHYPGRLCITKTEQEQAVKEYKAKQAPKVLHYERRSFVKESRKNSTANIGDIVQFDVYECRRTGKLGIKNARVIERAEISTNDEEAGTGMGIVHEIVVKRNFGFISVVDESSNKKESLFFHLSKISKDEDRHAQLKKGDEVSFKLSTEKGKPVAVDVTLLPKGTIPNQAHKDACKGIILMEPTYLASKKTSLSHQSSKESLSSGGSRWDSVGDDLKKISSDVVTQQGFILLTEDSSEIFGKHNGSVRVLRYKNGALSINGKGASSASDERLNPRRGDLVSFMKARKGNGLRDIRLEERGAAPPIRGKLINVPVGGDTSDSCQFVVADELETKYSLTDIAQTVVSCEPSILQENEAVEAILYKGQVHGVCRASDLYLESRLGAGHTERPKLNLTVKKDRGGTIHAQSGMAKGPDDSIGFVAGWTSRTSRYLMVVSPEDLGASEVSVAISDDES